MKEDPLEVGVEAVVVVADSRQASYISSYSHLVEVVVVVMVNLVHDVHLQR